MMSGGGTKMLDRRRLTGRSVRPAARRLRDGTSGIWSMLVKKVGKTAQAVPPLSEYSRLVLRCPSPHTRKGWAR